MGKRIGLVVKNDSRVLKQAEDLQRWLGGRGCDVVRQPDESSRRRKARPGAVSAPAGLYCVIVLGGDGTFLSAVRWLGPNQAPVLGVKYGEVGFMAEATAERLYAVVENILTNPFETQQRTRLSVEVWDGQRLEAGETILNDVVINKGALARLAHIRTYVDDKFLTDYRADGLIVATPTGSTAYSLAAGGPIIHPEVQGILITPICPFTLTNRSLIVPDTAAIKIKLAEKSADIMLTFDGQVGLPINDHHTIVVRKDPRPVNMIVLPDRQYFDVLKAKLKWSGSRL